MIDREASGFETRTPRIERGDRYSYVKATERDDPAHALLARQVHAVSYRGEGFIHDDAIDASGQVVADIDKARGEHVEYYLGYSTENAAVSTLRKVSTDPEAGIESLPAYQLCEDFLSEEGVALLQRAEAAGRPIKEISSFGHIPKESAASGLELLRNVLQESYGTDEVWLFTMVSKKYKTLVNLFGPQAVRKIGEDVPMTDERVGDVFLTPALVDTTSFFDDIKDGIMNEASIRRRARLIHYLAEFSEGLERATLSDEVLLLLEDTTHFDLATYAEKKGVEHRATPWQQPLQFDLTNRVDTLQVKRLIDDGKIRTVTDPTWDEAAEGSETPADGPWVYYPWRDSLTHFPDKDTYRRLRHSRDRHMVTQAEQDELYTKSALFAGLSVGSHVLEHMVYAGVGGSHVLADFDTVSVSNLNRIHVGMAEVDEAKVDVFAKRVSELDPYMELTLLREGIRESSLRELSRTPSIIFDEVDDFAAKALLRMYAKERGVPLIMATDVGYKSVIDVERYDLEDTEPFNGRLSQDTIDAMLRGTLTPEARMKITTKLIGLGNASVRLLKSVSDPSLASFPQLDVTASQGGALATIVARDILLGRTVPSGRRVHDARRAMKLASEESMTEGLKVLKQFLTKR